MVKQIAIFLFAMFINLNAFAQESKKVALVIGNGAYANANHLTNPANDARVVATALRQAGFSAIDLRTDLDLQAFQAALRHFAVRARGADIALIYFAGHGMEANGQNWLVPTDAKLTADTDLEFEAVRLESLLRVAEGARVRIVAVDACRDNPFVRSMSRTSTMYAASQGLASIEVDDFVIMYAAAARSTAEDGTSGNSPFASALASRLLEPGVDVRLLAGKIRDDVLRETQGRQRPFVSTSISGRPLYLFTGSGIRPPDPSRIHWASSDWNDVGVQKDIAEFFVRCAAVSHLMSMAEGMGPETKAGAERERDFSKTLAIFWRSRVLSANSVADHRIAVDKAVSEEAARTERIRLENSRFYEQYFELSVQPCIDVQPLRRRMFEIAGIPPQ